MTNETAVSKSDLELAIKEGKRFGSLILTGKELRNIRAEQADLRLAFLDKNDLQGADLRMVNLSFSRLTFCKLDYADLSAANLTYTSFYGASLRHTRLVAAFLPSAYLQRVDLTGARLKHSYATHAVLKEANLKSSVLSFCDLSDACLDGANLGRYESGRFCLTISAVFCSCAPFANEFIKQMATDVTFSFLKCSIATSTLDVFNSVITEPL